MKIVVVDGQGGRLGGLLVERVKFTYIHDDGSIDIEFNFQDQYRRIVEFVENNQKELYVLGGKAVS